ncbi:MAG TPA: hypothetical protein VKZ63_13455 [Kofleriaceae bacterium]|nr:hypothetical protein [Kofleriaceae bacterium]
MPTGRRAGAACAIALAIACSSREADGPDLSRMDPARASEVVQSLATGCAGLSRALAAIDRSQFSGPVLAGLVDDAVAAADCVEARGEGDAFRLARARLRADRPAEALAELPAGSREPAVRLRRAELLDALGRPAEALAELDGLPPGARPDDERLRSLRVPSLAASGRVAEAAALVRAAPLPERPALATRAVAAAPAGALGALAAAAGDEPDLLAAAADRIEKVAGPAAALEVRERAAAAAPDRAEPWDALGRARLASGQLDAALEAWDRAAAAAPAQPAYRLAPIRALAASGEAARARERAMRVIAAARRRGIAEALVTGSAAAAAAGDARLAVELAREAQAARPGDGRLAFLVAERLTEAGEREAAAAALVELLVCGARGRPWHRHEVAGRLLRLARDPAARPAVTAALDAPRRCETVDPAGLTVFVDGVRGAARGTASPAR